MSDEELELQDEVAAARAETERLQVAAADREARAAHFEAQVADLRERLAQAQEQAQTREQELIERARVLEAQVESTAQRYRGLALELSPELPAELVAGGTVEEIEASLERARETVAKVRGHIESEAQARRVPVGAPPRSGPDLSSLSAEEKIRLGLRRREAS